MPTASDVQSAMYGAQANFWIGVGWGSPGLGKAITDSFASPFQIFTAMSQAGINAFGAIPELGQASAWVMFGLVAAFLVMIVLLAGKGTGWVLTL